MDLINKVEEVRRKNNKNWMNLLRLALELDPQRTKIIIKDIVEHDEQVTKNLKELLNE